MKIGIIAAMSKELALLLPHIENVGAQYIAPANNRGGGVPAAGFSEFSESSEFSEPAESSGPSKTGGPEIHYGRMGRHEVAAMQSGIGKVNAALGCAALIDAFAPDLIINTGVAGGTGSEARVMDVVLGLRVAYHDVWCGPCAERGQVQGLPRFFPCADVVAALPSQPGLHRGLIVSGDQFVDNAADLARILALYPDALAVDMESAAMAQTCYLRRVPFASLRVVSDTPGREADNTAQYLDFWTAAPAATFAALTAIIQTLP